MQESETNVEKTKKVIVCKLWCYLGFNQKHLELHLELHLNYKGFNQKHLELLRKFSSVPNKKIEYSQTIDFCNAMIFNTF